MNTYARPRPLPGAFEEQDRLLVSALHLLAAHQLSVGEKFSATVIENAAVALDEYRAGYRLACPKPDTGFHLVELELESVSATEVVIDGKEPDPVPNLIIMGKFQMGEIVGALVADEKEACDISPPHRVRSGRIVGITTITETPGYLVDIAGQVFNFDEKQLWRVGEEAEVAP